ncbi:hypothetical protein ANCDUO_01241 [Ancylostoma duodenale]|uniref:Uncharacterized protein n=1 Tax=Ancylostoma duodenale TaxID=51022 RepID=A0A0C2DEP5_9BILA|nr:hypothetical protein ANCDUO_01241 [Ancylostoma duodenale]
MKLKTDQKLNSIRELICRVNLILRGVNVDAADQYLRQPPFAKFPPKKFMTTPQVTNGWKARPSRHLVKRATKQMRREHKATVTLAVVLG